MLFFYFSFSSAENQKNINFETIFFYIVYLLLNRNIMDQHSKPDNNACCKQGETLQTENKTKGLNVFKTESFYFLLIDIILKQILLLRIKLMKKMWLSHL